jgi:hypothetical protein
MTVTVDFTAFCIDFTFLVICPEWLFAPTEIQTHDRWDSCLAKKTLILVQNSVRKVFTRQTKASDFFLKALEHAFFFFELNIIVQEI